MLCRSTSTGVLSTLLPTVSHTQSGYNGFNDQTERSTPDHYLPHHHVNVSTPRSALQSLASQHLKPAADVSRSADHGGDWDCDVGTSTVLQSPGKFRKVQSENDLQSLWRSSSGSAATFAAAGSFHSTASQGCHEDDRDQLGTLARLASERGSAILEMAEDMSPAGSEVSEEPREMPSMMNHGSFWNEKATMGGEQHSRQFSQEGVTMMEDYERSLPAAESSSFSINRRARSSAKVLNDSFQQEGHQEASGIIRSRRASTLEAPRGGVMGMTGYQQSSSPLAQNGVRRPMLITDLVSGNGSSGNGRGPTSGGRGGSGGGYGDSNGVDAQYQRMLAADPGHPLLLRNYARFLHEVMRNPLRAEPYYERAILANPGDGEVLGRYAQLVWELYKDEERAGGYFDQALQACPDDCYLNATYASFLWSSEGDKEEAEVAHDSQTVYIHNLPPPLYGAAAVSA